MPRVSYVNGRYVPHDEAVVSVEDRGYQFADAVYEVLPVAGGRVRHLDRHLDRLGRSLAALAMDWPVARRSLPVILAEVVRRNRVTEGVVYLQATRGVARRNHLFPPDAVPSLVVSAWRQTGPSAATVAQGIAVVTRPDLRWKRPDIKTVGLLANVLARQSAKEEGAYEAWLTDAAGRVTEGSATNAYIIDREGTLRTHPADGAILGGVTRSNVLDLAREMGLAVAETPFTVAEAKAAREAFVSGTTVMVLPVVSIDGEPVGDGRPGAATLRLREFYEELRRR
ncbi:MAG: D-amino-acid transaminase [Magnetospirillum sp.]|nr:D-amino-acid transaminase [Magnetospirillum sp.]